MCSSCIIQNRILRCTDTNPPRLRQSVRPGSCNFKLGEVHDGDLIKTVLAKWRQHWNLWEFKFSCHCNLGEWVILCTLGNCSFNYLVGWGYITLFYVKCVMQMDFAKILRQIQLRKWKKKKSCHVAPNEMPRRARNPLIWRFHIHSRLYYYMSTRKVCDKCSLERALDNEGLGHRWSSCCHMWMHVIGKFM